MEKNAKKMGKSFTHDLKIITPKKIRKYSDNSEKNSFFIQNRLKLYENVLNFPLRENSVKTVPRAVKVKQKWSEYGNRSRQYPRESENPGP